MFATIIVKFFLSVAAPDTAIDAANSAADAHCASAADVRSCLEEADILANDVWDHPARR